MKRKTSAALAIVCLATLLTLGAGLIAFGQATNAPTPAEAAQLQAEQVLKLQNDLEALTKRMDALEVMVRQMNESLNRVRTQQRAEKRAGK